MATVFRIAPNGRMQGTAFQAGTSFHHFEGKRRRVVLLFVGGAAHEVFMQDVAGT